MFFNEQRFNEWLEKTNFHKADYVCLYFIQSHTWALAKKVDNTYVIDNSLPGSDPRLAGFKFPASLSTIYFKVDRDATDDAVPKEVEYRFYD
jgi:hypothetical protein